MMEVRYWRGGILATRRYGPLPDMRPAPFAPRVHVRRAGFPPLNSRWRRILGMS